MSALCICDRTGIPICHVTNVASSEHSNCFTAHPAGQYLAPHLQALVSCPIWSTQHIENVCFPSSKLLQCIFVSGTAQQSTMQKSLSTKTHKCQTPPQDCPAPLSPQHSTARYTLPAADSCTFLGASLQERGMGAVGKLPWPPNKFLSFPGSSLAEYRS